MPCSQGPRQKGASPKMLVLSRANNATPVIAHRAYLSLQYQVGRAKGFGLGVETKGFGCRLDGYVGLPWGVLRGFGVRSHLSE